MARTSGSGYQNLVFQRQGDAHIDQVAVQNTWYPVLDTTLNVRIYDISWMMATATETIELRITHDGIADMSIAAACTNDTIYTLMLNRDPQYGSWTPVSFKQTATECLIYKPFLIEARSLKVEIRKTTAAGANHLFCKVTYGKR